MIPFEIGTDPLSYAARNGCVFSATRMDLFDGVTVHREEEIPIERLVADVAEFAAWHALRVLPTLDGFAGYDALRFHFRNAP